MTTPDAPLVTGTDFITVGTTNFDAAREFYGTVLGLQESKRWGKMPAVEFETGNLTITVMQSDAFCIEFRPNNLPIELRVDDVEAARAILAERGVTFKGDTWTPASAIRRVSTTRTATPWRSTTATRRTADAGRDRAVPLADQPSARPLEDLARPAGAHPPLARIVRAPELEVLIE